MDRMKHVTRIAFVLLMATCTAPAFSQKTFVLCSPDEKFQSEIKISTTDIKYNIKHDGDLLLAFSRIHKSLDKGRAFGINPKLSGTKPKTVDRILNADIYKKKEVRDNFNELTLKFKGNYRIVFRAYNEGIAYRFESDIKGDIIVDIELSEFNFLHDAKAYIP